MTELKPAATLSLTRVLSVTISGALILAIVSWYFWRDHIALASLRLWLPLWLVTAFVYGFAHTEKPIKWLQKWLRYTRLEMFKISGGIYAAMAAALFVTMEVQRAFSSISELFDDKTNWISAFFAQFISFSVDSFMNAIYAVAWPGFLTKTVGFANAWWALGPAFFLYWLVLKLLGVNESPSVWGGNRSSENDSCG